MAISARTVLHNVVKVYMMLNSHFDFTRFVRPFVYFMTLSVEKDNFVENVFLHKKSNAIVRRL